MAARKKKVNLHANLFDVLLQLTDNAFANSMGDFLDMREKKNLNRRVYV